MRNKVLSVLLFFLLVMVFTSCEKDYSSEIVEEFDVVDRIVETKENPDFKILEVDAIAKDDHSYVFGKVKNTSKKDFDLASIKINIYNENEEIIEEISDSVKDFKKEGVWEFKALINKENACNFEVYEIIGE